LAGPRFFAPFLRHGQKRRPRWQAPPEGNMIQEISISQVTFFDELRMTLYTSSSMTIVTKTGDRGETGLFGGQRVAKDDIRIEAIGTVDELNAHLSLPLQADDLSLDVIEQIAITQNTLFTVGADLATPRTDNKAIAKRITPEHITQLEQWIATFESTPLPPYFVLPGGSEAAGHLHVARAVCRRAERLVVSLGKQIDIGQDLPIYLNRLSDYLFLAALEANRSAGMENIRVRYW
jgi:cob(I)alamin adenosyltransferase